MPFALPGRRRPTPHGPETVSRQRGGTGTPVEVLGDHDVGEDLGRLGQVLVGFGVPLREVGEHQPSGARVARDLGGLPGGSIRRPAAVGRRSARRTVRGMYRFEAELWLHEGEGAWCFLTVPGHVSDDVRACTQGVRRGFGSVGVRVTVGGTTWSTSVFPDGKRGAYLLPVKKDVRMREGLDDGDRVAVGLELL
jgi:hypothetical protein